MYMCVCVCVQYVKQLNFSTCMRVYVWDHWSRRWENNHVSVREQKGYICHSAFSHMHFDKAHEPATITRQTLLPVKNAHTSHASQSMTKGMRLIQCSRVKSASVGVAVKAKKKSVCAFWNGDCGTVHFLFCAWMCQCVLSVCVQHLWVCALCSSWHIKWQWSISSASFGAVAPSFSPHSSFSPLASPSTAP